MYSSLAKCSSRLLNIRPRQHLCSLLSTNSAVIPTLENGKLGKRNKKVALTVGYVGTGYYGLQLLNEVGRVTVEGELREALFQSGTMLESNYANLSKLDWSRSSRTDKGVHAQFVLIGCKLLVEEDKIDEKSGVISGLADTINSFLPDTIRVFSCTHATKRFNAREFTTLREYEYLMPVDFIRKCLQNDETDIQDIIESMRTHLKLFCGRHDFHNFTKSRANSYRRHHKHLKQDADSENVEMAPFIQDEAATTRPVIPTHSRVVYSCKCSNIVRIDGQDFVRINLVGQSFLLNQIRIMIGSALSVATGQISSSHLEAALTTNRIIRMPVAPAEGLLLSSCSFAGQKDRDYKYIVVKNAKEKYNYNQSSRALLTMDQMKDVHKFREEVINPSIVKAWCNPNTIETWFNDLENCKNAHSQISDAEIENLISEKKRKMKETLEVKHFHTVRRRRELLNGTKDHDIAGVFHSTFATSLMVKFDILPGELVYKVELALLQDMLKGHLSIDSHTEELLDYVEKNGVQALAARFEGRLK